MTTDITTDENEKIEVRDLGFAEAIFRASTSNALDAMTNADSLFSSNASSYIDKANSGPTFSSYVDPDA